MRPLDYSVLQARIDAAAARLADWRSQFEALLTMTKERKDQL